MSAEDFEERLKDPAFVKRIEKQVTLWVRDIRRITTLQHDPSQGSALQEINFWLAIERSLTHVEQQLKNNKMLDVTLSLVQQSNNLPLFYKFQNDLELKPKLKQSREYNQLLRDFAINQLLAATDMDMIRSAVEKIFAQFRQIRHAGESYPSTRAILLLDTVIKDFNEQLLKVLRNFSIMRLEFQQFEGLRR